MTLLKFNIILILIAVFSDSSFAQNSERVLGTDKIIKLIPDRIKGFNQLIDPKARLTRIGTITYSLCEKNFDNGKKTVKILLFDYKEASIMYTQAMREWSNNRTVIESDTLVSRTLIMKNCSGWESYRHANRTSQIFLGICDRFFLTITGQNVELETLKKILLEIPIDKFPK